MEQKIDRPLLVNLYKNGLTQVKLANMFAVSRGRVSIIIHEEFSPKQIADINNKRRLKRDIDKVKARYEKKED